MEREFTDYDEWMEAGGDPTYGQGVSQVQYPTPTPYVPPAAQTGAPPVPPTTGGGGGKTPQQIEQEGRAYDASNGLIGGYMMNGVWVNGSPGGGGGISGGGIGDGFGGTTSPNEGFQWPTYSAPRFSFGEFGGFKPFKPPTGDEIMNDPVLQAQLKEGNNRIKQDRAFRGILNTGDTLKDIFDWTSDRVKLGAHDAWDRSFKTYDINERQNPFNTWTANKGLALDTFDRNAGQFKDEFDYNQYKPAEARWKQNYDKWAAQLNALATDNT